MATVIYNCKHCKTGKRVSYPNKHGDSWWRDGAPGQGRVYPGVRWGAAQVTGDRTLTPGCHTPEGCRENGCLGWCDEHRPEAGPDSKTPNVGGNRLAPTQEQR